MKKCRFKTEEEFKALLGLNWKRRLGYGWNSDGDMDYLIGKTLTPEQYKTLLQRGDTSVDNWSISKDMLIEEEVKPEFKNGVRVMENGLMTE